MKLSAVFILLACGFMTLALVGDFITGASNGAVQITMLWAIAMLLLAIYFKGEK